MEVQQYKGLGEMSAKQLWETTMNPATHTLIASEVPPRKAFIQGHARSVRNLDI